MGKGKSNGSVLKLAEAFNDVIIDAVSPLEERLNAKMDTMEARK